MSADYREAPANVFNSPFETGVRSVLVLTSAFPTELALDELTALDHLVVHTGDLIDGPESLHPAEPTRAAEMLVRRALVDSGLKLMACKGLVEMRATANGFRYCAGEEAGSFVDLLSSEYALELKKRADWLAANVVALPSSEFEYLVASQLDRWGIYDESQRTMVSD